MSKSQVKVDKLTFASSLCETGVSRIPVDLSRGVAQISFLVNSSI